MKRFTSCLIAGLGISLLATAAHANIVVFAGGEDICSDIYGKWKGKGTVVADIKIGKIKCDYSGKANITDKNDGTFNMNIELKKETGVCPDKTLDLPGACKNGAIQIKTDSANLHGTTDGKTAKVEGTVTLIVAGIPITAEVQNMSLQKLPNP